MPAQIRWIKCESKKCESGAWCKLNSVNLQHSHFDGLEGVYIIWHYDGQRPETLYVGQGKIRERLSAHHENVAIQNSKYGPLHVTWAKVDAGDRDGVEAYLGDKLRPLVGEKFPAVHPVAVDLPEW
ncbi:MAG: hypothetical protein OXU71_10455 [Gammaproteobacteria bacterium]|nr:hypothetical protein [Gammaproteobacteria bacterium]